MRILFINHMGFMGGGERSMLALMLGLRKDYGHQVYLLAQPGELTEKARELGFLVYEYMFARIRRTTNPLSWLTTYCRIRNGIKDILKTIYERDIEIVHANSLKSAIMGGLAAHRAGIPMVFHTRDFLPAGIWRKVLVTLAYNFSSRIIANSKSVAKLYGKDYKHKVTVVYNHVEIPNNSSIRPPEAVRAENGCQITSPLLGYSGRLHKAKGIETLMLAFKIVRENLPEANLWIVGGTMPGEEKYAEELKNLAKKLNIFSRTVFFGWREDALALMNCFDLIVVPSQKEPFGRVTVESMLMGIPVVATASGGTLEIIDDGKTGLLFNPGDSKDLAYKCLLILNDSELRDRLIAEARNEVSRRFNSNKYIGGVQKVYDSLVGK